MDINNTILPFGEYFLLTLRTGGKKFLPLFLTFVISFLAIIILFIICLIPIGLALVNYIPSDILQNTYALEYYIYTGEFFYTLAPALPLIAISFVLMGFFTAVIQCFQNAMVYTITDSSIRDYKNSFGKMFAFAIKRTFPVLGTTILLSLIYIGIYIVFAIAVTAIAMSIGIDISSFMYYEDISSQMQLGIFSIICFVLLLIMLFFMILLGLIYSMSIFSRVKYKFSGISSLRYSRLLTKGKRGKIFGNMLLFGLIYMVIAGLLSYASSVATDYGISFLPFLIQAIIALIGVLASVFWAVMFINFDNVKGGDIISGKFADTVNIKDAYFQSDADAQNHTYNQNNTYQTDTPVRGDQTDIQLTDSQADNKNESSLEEINGSDEQQTKTDEHNTTE